MTQVRSIVVEVDGEDGGATVAVRRLGSGWRITCSCDARTPDCTHVMAALGGLSEASSSEIDATPSSAHGRSPLSVTSTPREPPSRVEPLLGALSVLLEAMLRAAAGEVTTAVDSALRNATDALAAMPLPGVARVLTRAAASLGQRGSALDSTLAVTALGEAIAALGGERGEESRAEVIGTGAELTRLDNLTLVEVARAESGARSAGNACAGRPEDGRAVPGGGRCGRTRALCGSVRAAGSCLSRLQADLARTAAPVADAVHARAGRRGGAPARGCRGCPRRPHAAPRSCRRTAAGSGVPARSVVRAGARYAARNAAFLADANGHKLGIDRGRDPAGSTRWPSCSTPAPRFVPSPESARWTWTGSGFSPGRRSFRGIAAGNWWPSACSGVPREADASPCSFVATVCLRRQTPANVRSRAQRCRARKFDALSQTNRPGSPERKPRATPLRRGTPALPASVRRVLERHAARTATGGCLRWRS